MALAQKLDLRQGQQLVMTPQLQQAIKMLQMSNLELGEFIAEELERNPLLEIASPDSAPEPDHAADGPETPATLEKELAQDRLSRTEETFDTGQENIYADEAAADRMNAKLESTQSLESVGAMSAASAWATVGAGGSSRFDDPETSLEATHSREETLREHLLGQLGSSTTDAALRLVTADLIEQLDENGYLRADLVGAAERLGASLETVAAAADLLKSFDPVGVGAADLRECLALQLIDKNRFDPAMEALLENLELLANHELPKLMKKCGVDEEDIREMISEIRALDPKPGAKFDTDIAQTMIPDVYVIENRFGGWNVELNTETLPRLLLNKSYAAEIARSANGKTGEITEYLTERQQNASWLMKSIDQRAKTILRVASEIVRQQDGFFAYGISAMRPLNLKAVADAIDMHESTVSRVTSNKYIATPRGVFEMKYFFTPAIASMDGEDAYSAEAVRHRIKRLIDNEPADDVLSDDRIVAMLRSDGVDIARRTVAKYREAMRIPSSVRRRKLKSAELVL
ncbi:MAG: RNA polymerase factor sigma-54 [Neomegalonema sp.]